MSIRNAIFYYILSHFRQVEKAGLQRVGLPFAPAFLAYIAPGFDELIDNFHHRIHAIVCGVAEAPFGAAHIAGVRLLQDGRPSWEIAFAYLFYLPQAHFFLFPFPPQSSFIFS